MTSINFGVSGTANNSIKRRGYFMEAVGYQDLLLACVDWLDIMFLECIKIELLYWNREVKVIQPKQPFGFNIAHVRTNQVTHTGF